MELTFIDLFAGVGMARMGMEQAGFKCVYTCEFDKHKRKEYEIIHGNIPEGCDIRDVRAADIPRADVWFFGAPCQDFSIAGLRKGLGGYEKALAFPNSTTRRGRVGKEVAQTLDRSCNQGVFIQDGEEYVIRKLTPKECMRLQGVPDEYTDKLIQAGISDSQIYKAAGDGLSVPIAKEIGERIRKTYEENN